nr:unnamed protein product [Digitaria exilis]
MQSGPEAMRTRPGDDAVGNGGEARGLLMISGGAWRIAPSGTSRQAAPPQWSRRCLEHVEHADLGPQPCFGRGGEGADLGLGEVLCSWWMGDLAGTIRGGPAIWDGSPGEERDRKRRARRSHLCPHREMKTSEWNLVRISGSLRHPQPPVASSSPLLSLSLLSVLPLLLAPLSRVLSLSCSGADGCVAQRRPREASQGRRRRPPRTRGRGWHGGRCELLLRLQLLDSVQHRLHLARSSSIWCSIDSIR